MLADIYEPWFWRMLAAALLSAWLCALVGVPLYLRRRSMVADALAHTALPGIVLAYLVSAQLGGWVLVGGVALTGWVTVLLVDRLSARRGVRSDAAIGVAFTGLFALGVVLVSTLGRDAHLSLSCLLFGDMMGVRDASFLLMGSALLLALGGYVLGGAGFCLALFDPLGARVMGLPTRAYDQGWMVLTAVAIAASFEAVGVVLVLALVVLPAATAHQHATSWAGLILAALGWSTLATLAGVVLALWWDVSTAGMVVCVALLLYALPKPWSQPVVNAADAVLG